MDRDPSTRGDIFRGDELRAFSEVAGLAVDSAALFILAEACSLDFAQKGTLREWIRDLNGQLTLEMAQARIPRIEPT